MGQLTLPVLRETLLGEFPRFRLRAPRNYPHTHATIEFVLRVLSLVIPCWFRILHSRCANCLGGLQSCLRRSGNEDSWKKLRREGRCHSQLVDLIEFPFHRDRFASGEKLLDNACVLDDPLITLVMRRRVVQRGQIVLEPPGDQIEVDTASVKKSE